ncbi:uncharacterized protein C5L36_0C11640 [Pichia kudriavzevii]|uniref:Uncharacterized protein n=1 Tax=Pichia kudriavzevii TaxID=4909 RepID=A0A2U9R8K7_PICKU|nr:uncharacterized protein C5L36_0C11640 [Pichia kudriavzevii]AWU77258.1 hypothetical protein C5L36_0C11640 [Pichia kudriavzevii]
MMDTDGAWFVLRKLPIEIQSHIVNLSLRRWFNISEIVLFLINNYENIESDSFLSMVFLKNLKISIYNNKWINFNFDVFIEDRMQITNKILVFEKLLKKGKITISKFKRRYSSDGMNLMYEPQYFQELFDLHYYSQNNHFYELSNEVSEQVLPRSFHNKVELSTYQLATNLGNPEKLMEISSKGEYTFVIHQFEIWKLEDCSSIKNLINSILRVENIRIKFELEVHVNMGLLSNELFWKISKRLLELETSSVKIYINLALDNPINPPWCHSVSCHGFNENDDNWIMFRWIGTDLIYTGNLKHIMEYMNKVDTIADRNLPSQWFEFLPDFVKNIRLRLDEDLGENEVFEIPKNLDVLTIENFDKPSEIDFKFLENPNNYRINALRVDILIEKCEIPIRNFSRLAKNVQNLVFASDGVENFSIDELSWDFKETITELDWVRSNLKLKNTKWNKIDSELEMKKLNFEYVKI